MIPGGCVVPTLDWIGKRAVVGHHLTLPYRLLKCDADLSVGGSKDGNLLVQGDNLEALRALVPHYGRSVKCVYIDPPYNTGATVTEKGGWFYDDRVDSPEIRDWLSKVVGKEGEDFSRHDKWLCMMYPRIKLIHELLREDGVLFVSIDDNEHRHLHLLLDEIFGGNNHVGTIIWYNTTDNNPSRVVTEHEYIICFARNKKALETPWTGTEDVARKVITEKAAELFREHQGDHDALKKAYSTWFRRNKKELSPFDEYDRIDEKGEVYTASRSVHNPNTEGYRYDIPHPVTGRPTRQPLRGYRFPEDKALEILARDGFIFEDDDQEIVRLRLDLKDWKKKLSSVYELDGRRGATDLRAMFGGDTVFNNPKPVALIADLIEFSTKPGDIVLDSFGGSGTTGHAVLAVNARLPDKERRRFVLIEKEDRTATEVTAVRLRRVIEGYQRAGRGEKRTTEPGLGGGFKFCRLGEPLFDAEGAINEAVTFAELAAHVFFTETGVPISSPATGESALLGVQDERAVFLLRAGGPPGQPAHEGVLTPSLLRTLVLPEGARERVVYAEGCTVTPDRLRAAGVTFKHIPYQIGGR